MKPWLVMSRFVRRHTCSSGAVSLESVHLTFGAALPPHLLPLLFRRSQKRLYSVLFGCVRCSLFVVHAWSAHIHSTAARPVLPCQSCPLQYRYPVQSLSSCQDDDKVQLTHTECVHSREAVPGHEPTTTHQITNLHYKVMARPKALQPDSHSSLPIPPIDKLPGQGLTDVGRMRPLCPHYAVREVPWIFSSPTQLLLALLVHRRGVGRRAGESERVMRCMGREAGATAARPSSTCHASSTAWQEICAMS